MKKKIIAFSTVLTLIFLLVSDALAMSSTNYALNWFPPLTGSGGSQMISTNYKVQVTIGQTVIGASTSTNYRVGLGYWYGVLTGGPIYLPLIVR